MMRITLRPSKNLARIALEWFEQRPQIAGRITAYTCMRDRFGFWCDFSFLVRGVTKTGGLLIHADGGSSSGIPVLLDSLAMSPGAQTSADLFYESFRSLYLGEPTADRVYPRPLSESLALGVTPS